MGIYIKGAELPTSCRSCPFENGGDCYGGKAKYIMDVDDDEKLFRNSRHPDCPLVYIPEPHGRLIDENSLMKYFNVYKYEEWTSEEVSRLINNTPTVIEGSD